MKNSGAKRLIIKFRAQIKSKKNREMRERMRMRMNKENKVKMMNFNLIVMSANNWKVKTKKEMMMNKSMNKNRVVLKNQVK